MQCNLYNQDCLKQIKSIKDASVDLILTDPPYNIAKYSSSTFGRDMLQKGIEMGIIDPSTGKPFAGFEGIWNNINKSGGLDTETRIKSTMGEREMAAMSVKDIAEKFDNKK